MTLHNNEFKPLQDSRGRFLKPADRPILRRVTVRLTVEQVRLLNRISTADRRPIAEIVREQVDRLISSEEPQNQN